MLGEYGAAGGRHRDTGGVAQSRREMPGCEALFPDGVAERVLAVGRAVVDCVEDACGGASGVEAARTKISWWRLLAHWNVQLIESLRAIVVAGTREIDVGRILGTSQKRGDKHHKFVQEAHAAGSADEDL